MRLCPACARRFDDVFERCTEDGTGLVPDTSRPTLPPGTTLDVGGTVVRLIGAGPTGEVYEADWAEGRVAVKLLSESMAAERGAMSRLAGLVERLTKVDHPGVARVFGQGDFQGRLLIVRELVEGQSVGAVVRGEGPMPPERAFAVTMSAAEAIAEAHRRGALHLNLRPSNLFVARGGGIKLVDFGIGARLELGGQILYGDSRYMAPEQLEGKLVSFRSDIYGLGSLLYFLLTGQPPFDGAPEGVMANVISTAPPSPSEMVSALAAHRELDGVVLRALEKTPSKRYLSVQHFARAMDGVLHGGGGRRRDDKSPTMPRIRGASAPPGATLEMGVVGRQGKGHGSLGTARTLEMGAVGRPPPSGGRHDTIQTAPPPAAPVHPRLARNEEFDDTIRMDVESSNAKDTIEMRPPPAALAQNEGDTVRTELPEARALEGQVPSPSAPLPPPRPPAPVAEPMAAAPPPAAAHAATPPAAPATVPAPKASARADTVPIRAPIPRTQPPPEEEDDDIPELEIVEEEPLPPPRQKRRRRKPPRAAEVAVRAEAAVRFNQPGAVVTDSGSGDAVEVDQRFLEEAKGPERNRATMEIRLPEGGVPPVGTTGSGSVAAADPRRSTLPAKRGKGRIVAGVVLLVILFVLAAVAAASVARWLTASPTTPPSSELTPSTSPEAPTGAAQAPSTGAAAGSPNLELLTPPAPAD